MENVLGSLLPKFSSHEKEKLKKGLDFIGLNYYTAFMSKIACTPRVSYDPGSPEQRVHTRKMQKRMVSQSVNLNVPSNSLQRSSITFSPMLNQFSSFSFLQTPFSWFNIYIYPDGMEKAVTCVRDRYNNTPIFITENGKQHKLNFLLFFFLLFIFIIYLLL